MLIKSVKNFATEQLKILIFGPPGIGKTSLAATTPGKALVVSAEAGLLSLADHDIDFVDIATDDNGTSLSKADRIEKLDQVYKWLQTPEAKKKYSWVFLDSLTEIGQNVVEKQNAIFPERKDSLVMWGEVGKEMRSLIKAWRDLPGYNVVFTALSEVDKDEVGARFQNVSLQGKIAQQIPGYFDEVFFYHSYQTDEGTRRVLITQPTDKVVAKDRSGKLDLMMEPNLSVIAARIRGTNAKAQQVEKPKRVELSQQSATALQN